MSLSDIMGNMDLSVYPQIGLVIFLAVFAGMVARICSGRDRTEWRRCGEIPMTEPRVARIERAGERPTQRRSEP